jgi:threonylcarbamoyladenosine tRNA methylthiotransferase MtaB
VFVGYTGCPESRMDATFLEKHMRKNGWTEVRDWRDADLIILNACGRSQNSVDDAVNIIRNIRSRKSKKQRLLILGCLAKIENEVLKKELQDVEYDWEEAAALQNIIDSEGVLKAIPAGTCAGCREMQPKQRLPVKICRKAIKFWDRILESNINLFKVDDESIFCLRVATGCSSNCSYCSIRKSRKTTRSKSIEKIMVEFQEGLRKGFKKFSLMGTDLGAYGSDLGYSLVDLLKEMVKQEGEYTIMLRNVNPGHLKNMLEEFTGVLNTGKINYLECAAESGSNRILKLMNRSYTVEEFKNCITTIKQAYPAIIIRTQMIVGFPTETSHDFNESMRLIEQLPFDYVEVYKYSERKGTPSEKINPKIPASTIRWRFLRMQQKALFNRTPTKINRILLHGT